MNSNINKLQRLISPVYLLLLLILIGPFFLRIYKLDSQGIWLDEKASIGTAVGIPYGYYESEDIGSWKEFHLNKNHNSTFTSNDFWKLNTLKNTYLASIPSNGAIAYYFTLFFWIKTFSTSDFSLRFLSVLFGLFTVIASYFISYS